MRPSIRAPLKGPGKGVMPASRPAVPKVTVAPKASLPVPAREEAVRPMSLKRKVDQVSGTVPGPRPKVSNTGKGPSGPTGPTPPRGKPMPMSFPEKGEKGDKGGKGAPASQPTSQAPKSQMPKASSTLSTSKPTSQNAVMPPKSKAAPEAAADKADGPKPPSDGPKPPSTEPPGYIAEKRFLPVPKGKTPEPAAPAGKPGTPSGSVVPKGAGKGGKEVSPGVKGGKEIPPRHGKGSAAKPPEAAAEAEPHPPKGGKGKGGESPAPDASKQLKPPYAMPVKDAQNANADSFQVQFRMKNLDSMQTRLLAEISGLPEDKRAEGFSKILDALPRILPRPALQQLADRLAADGVVSGNGAAAEQPAEEPAGAAGGEEETTAHDMMEDFLQNVESTSSIADYGKLWAQLGVPRESEVEVLSALLEVSVQKTTTFDLVPRVVAELARTRKVLVTSLEAALKDLARKLEDIVQANDQAWHLISYFLVYLFPRTRSSEWGFHFGGWNFPSWWKATEDILKEAHKWRAFDILVLSLQIMQEKSGSMIRQLPVWCEQGRSAQVMQTLSMWGEMDEASILETLSANGVELPKQ